MRCVALSDHRDAFLMTANAWSQALEAKRADVKRVTLHASPLANTTTVAHALAAILAAKVRVVLVFGPSAVLRTIALEASVSGMARAGWVWISDALCAQINAQDDTAEVRLPHPHALCFVSFVDFRCGLTAGGAPTNTPGTLFLLCPGHRRTAGVARLAILGSASARHGE